MPKPIKVGIAGYVVVLVWCWIVGGSIFRLWEGLLLVVEGAADWPEDMNEKSVFVGASKFRFGIECRKDGCPFFWDGDF